MSADERRVEEALRILDATKGWVPGVIRAHIDALTARLAEAERDLKRANEANANLAIQVLGKQRDLEAVRNDLADALDLKAGHGPTALSMLAAERDSLRAQYEQAHAALADLRSRLAGLGTYYRDITAIMALLTPPASGAPKEAQEQIEVGELVRTRAALAEAHAALKRLATLPITGVLSETVREIATAALTPPPTPGGQETDDPLLQWLD